MRVESRAITRSLFVVALYGAAGVGRAAAEPPPSTACFECHGVPGESPAGSRPEPGQIHVGDWEKSVHAGLECVDCHAGIGTLPHDMPLPAPSCSACHGDVVERYERSTHAARAAAGDSLAPRCATCHDPHTVRSSSDTTSVLHRTRVTESCVRCHGDANGAGSRATAVPHPAQSYARGAHVQAMADGNLRAATCGDCHDSHAVLRAVDPASPVHFARIAATCGRCHAEEFEAFRSSVHGVAAARGATGAPVCNTCHGEHAVAAFGEKGRPTIVAQETCESCHDNPALARRYDLPRSAVSSYEDSYHGRATRGGLAQAAGCTSCHGAHRILPKADPESSIHPANLVRTCSTCHPAATPTFATSYAHDPRGIASGDRAVATVRNVYLWLIGLVIGGMLVHNFVLWRHDLRRIFAEHRQSAVHVRLSRAELRQHQVLLVTFTLLVVTGFALRYNDAGWVQALGAIGFDEPVRRIVHRAAGVVFIVLSIYHTSWLFSRRGREQFRHLRPEATDLRHALDNVLYHLGRRSRAPRIGRFGYVEKAEYWALVWGTVVMAGTGLLLWFPETIQGPSWIVRVGEAIHLYEAWLAFLAIIVWHFFFVLVRPGIRGAFTAVTGRMDPELLAHEHPGEYEELYGAAHLDHHLAAPGGPEVAPTAGQRDSGGAS